MLHTDPEQEPLFIEFEKNILARQAAAVAVGLQLRELGREEGNKAIVNYCTVHLANYYSDVESRFQYTIQFVEGELNLLDPTIDYEAMGGYMITIGRNYALLGKLIECRDAYMKGRSLLEGKALARKGKRRLGLIYQNLSAIYTDLRLPEVAKEFNQKGFEVFTALNDKLHLVHTHSGFAALAETPEEKLSHLEKAIAYAQESGAEFWRVFLSASRGELLCNMDRTNEGMLVLQTAYKEVKTVGNKRYQSDVAQMLARMYFKQGNIPTANKYFQEAHELFLQAEAEYNPLDLYKQWADALRAEGLLEEALLKYDIHEKHRNAMHQFNTSAAVTEAQLRFQLEEGRREAEVLQKKNEEIEEYAHRLEISNRELSQFTHVASHDLKEPIRMVTNFSQLLEKSLNGSITPEQKSYISYLNEGGRRMMKVLNDLLQLSKINENVLREEIDATEVVQAIQTELAALIHKRNVHFSFSGLPRIDAEKAQLKLLFENLISNAIHHNHHPNPLVEIRYQKQNNYHRFEVHDNGPGIEEQYHEKIFSAFQRLHTREQYEGNGIGLAICQKIVDYQRGKIFVEDSVLGGSCFVVLLPKEA